MDRSVEFRDVLAKVEAESRSEAPLDRLTAAADESHWLTEVADGLLEHYVRLARARGASWAQIGNVLGTSKQAAQQRFPQASDGTQTPAAYAALVTAEAEALSLGHNYIGTEHILLALARTEEAAASQILRRHGATPETIERETRAVIGSADASSCHAPLAWTPRARRIAKLAGKHARRMGCRRIQSGHLLLAMVDQPDSVAAKILLDRLKLDVDGLREAAVRSVPGVEAA